MGFKIFTRLVFLLVSVCILQACPGKNQNAKKTQSKSPSSIEPPKKTAISPVDSVFKTAQLFAQAQKSDAELKTDFDRIKDDPEELKKLAELKVSAEDPALEGRNFAQLLALGKASPVVVAILQAFLKDLSPAEREALISSYKVGGLNAFALLKQKPRPGGEKEGDRLAMQIAMLKEDGTLIKDLDVATVNKILLLLPPNESSQMANTIGDPLRALWIQDPGTAAAIKHSMPALNGAEKTRLKSELMREVYLKDPSDRILEFLDNFADYGFSKKDIAAEDFKINDAADAHNILGFYVANRNIKEPKYQKKLEEIVAKVNTIVDAPKKVAQDALPQIKTALDNDDKHSKILLGLRLTPQSLFDVIEKASPGGENTDKAWDDLLAYYDNGGSAVELNNLKNAHGYRVIHFLTTALKDPKALEALKRHIEEAKLDAGTMLTEKTNFGDTPFILAVKNSKLLDGFILLRDKGAKPDDIQPSEINKLLLLPDDARKNTILQNLFVDLYKGSNLELNAWLNSQVVAGSHGRFKTWYSALKDQQKLEMLELFLKNKGQEKSGQDLLISSMQTPFLFGLAYKDLEQALVDDGSGKKGNLLWAAFGFMRDIDAEQIKVIANALSSRITHWEAFVNAKGGDGKSAFERAMPYFHDNVIETKGALKINLNVDEVAQLINTLGKDAAVGPIENALAFLEVNREQAGDLLGLILKRISADELSTTQMKKIIEALIKKGASLKNLSLENLQMLAVMAEGSQPIRDFLKKDTFGPSNNASFLWFFVNQASPTLDNRKNFRELALVLAKTFYASDDQLWKKALEKEFNGQSTLTLAQQRSLNIPDLDSAKTALLYPLSELEAKQVLKRLDTASSAGKPELLRKLFSYLTLNASHLFSTKLGEKNILDTVASADADEEALAVLQILLNRPTFTTDKKAVARAIDLAWKSDKNAPKYWDRLLLFAEKGFDLGVGPLEGLIGQVATTKNPAAMEALFKHLESSEEDWFKNLRKDQTFAKAQSFKAVYEAISDLSQAALLIKLFKGADVNEVLNIMGNHDKYGIDDEQLHNFIDTNFDLLQALKNSPDESIKHDDMRRLVFILRSNTNLAERNEWRKYIENHGDIIKIFQTRANPQLPFEKAAAILQYQLGSS